MKKKGLTQKQKIFISEYLVDKNATQACIRAGYSAKNADKIGPELLGNTRVMERLDKELAAQSARVLVNADNVLRRINQVADRCMQAEPVLDDEGNATGEYKFDSAGANQALKMLGQHLRLFTERVEIDVGGALAERIKQSRARDNSDDQK